VSDEDAGPLLAAIALSELQRLPCPRISAHDLLARLVDALIIDVRPHEEYRKITLSSSLPGSDSCVVALRRA
jgi:hypothetical protein